MREKGLFLQPLEPGFLGWEKASLPIMTAWLPA